MKSTFTKSQLLDWYNKKDKQHPGKYTERLKKYNNPDYHTFQDELNQHYKEKSGYKYLEMVREETLYPAVFCALKKYFGFKFEFKHIENPLLSDIMFKGLSIVSRSTAPFVVKFIQKTVMEILCTFKIDVYEFIINSLNAEILEMVNYPYSSFAQKQRYRPSVDNTARTIVTNMNYIHNTNTDPHIKELTKSPDPLEVVWFICIQDNRITDLKCRYGATELKKKTLRYYYLSVAEYMKLDIDYQDCAKKLLSTCAQFITYKTDFDFYQPGIPIAEYKKRIQNYLESECSKIYESSPVSILRKKRIDYVRILGKKCKKLFLEWVDRDIKQKQINILIKQLWNVKKTPMNKMITYCENFKYPGQLIRRHGSLESKENALSELKQKEEYINQIDRLIRYNFNMVICDACEKSLPHTEVLSKLPDMNIVLHGHTTELKKVLSLMWKYWMCYANYSLLDSV